MKDYIQVSESVFRKAEERMAEQKRRSAIKRRNVIAASGAAAVLFVVAMQNDDISNLIKSIPQKVSSSWFGSEPTTTQITTQTTTTKTASSTAAVTTTARTTSETTTETETTETTTASTTTTAAETTAQAVVTEPPVTTQSVDSMKQFFMIALSTRVVAADYDTVTLSNGYRISFIHGDYDLRGVFRVDDIIFYKASFAYDKNNDIYYYLNGCFEAEQRTIETDENGNYIEPYTEPYRGAPEPEDQRTDKYNKNEVLRKLKYNDSIPSLDYRDIIADPSLLISGEGFDEDTIYKIKVSSMEIKEADGFDKKFEDGREWYLYASITDGMQPEEIYDLKAGDVIDMVGLFRYENDTGALSAVDIYIKKVN